MNDDRPHEYVPQIAPGVLDARLQAKDLELREVKADLRQAQHDATERLIERNEAQRKANNLQILHDDAMAMLSAMTAERDAAHNVIGTLSARMTDAEAFARDWDRACDILTKAWRVAEAERDGYRNRWQMLERDIEPLRALATRVPILEENCAKLAAERDAARQSARAWKAKAKKLRAESDGMYQTVVTLSQAIVELRERAEKAEARG